MPKPIVAFVRFVDAMNRIVGRCDMYLIFAMMGVLLFESISRGIFDKPHIWVVEMAQFLLAAYYFLGGAYSIQTESHVRMDLLYSRWSPRGKAIADVITAVLLLYYLAVMLYGGISSAEYALQYDQKNYSAWAPPLAPIKIIMCIGILMMLLQILSTFIKDLATAIGKPIECTTS